MEPIDALADVEIAPDEGSAQTFSAGADRTASNRSYRVKIVSGPRPEDPSAREPNTLYSFQALGEQQAPSSQAAVIYRIYVEDQGRDITGGVGLPKVTLVAANGQETSGSEACSALEATSPPDLTGSVNTLPLGNAAPNTAAFKHLEWLKFFDLQGSQANRFNATPLGDPIAPAAGQSARNAGGFASNVHNNYVYTTLSQTLEPVAVIAGRAPNTPRTKQAPYRMEGGRCVTSSSAATTRTPRGASTACMTSNLRSTLRVVSSRW